MPQRKKLWANMEGIQVGPFKRPEYDIEFLFKDNACSLEWMPYTAGELLPLGAVTGGHLVDEITTYVAKVIYHGQDSFGYYNLKSAVAYFESRGVHTAISMDIFATLNV